MFDGKTSHPLVGCGVLWLRLRMEEAETTQAVVHFAFEQHLRSFSFGPGTVQIDLETMAFNVMTA